MPHLFCETADWVQRRDATIRGPRQQLLNNTKQTLKSITKNSRTVGGPLPPVGPPVTRRSSHPIVTPLIAFCSLEIFTQTPPRKLYKNTSQIKSKKCHLARDTVWSYMACEFPQRCGRLDCELLYPYSLLTLSDYRYVLLLRSVCGGSNKKNKTKKTTKITAAVGCGRQYVNRFRIRGVVNNSQRFRFVFIIRQTKKNNLREKYDDTSALL